MKPLNLILTLGLATLVPVSTLADRSGPRRCGNDRFYNSYNSGWGGYYGGGYGPGAIYGNPYQPRPYGGPASWNNGSWGYSGHGFGGGHHGIYRTDEIVRNGVRSGALSRDEVRDIREDQRDIWQKEQRYWSDGWLSPRERKDLRGDYRELNKDIRHNLNDGERRFRRR